MKSARVVRLSRADIEAAVKEARAECPECGHQRSHFSTCSQSEAAQLREMEDRGLDPDRWRDE